MPRMPRENKLQNKNERKRTRYEANQRACEPVPTTMASGRSSSIHSSSSSIYCNRNTNKQYSNSYINRLCVDVQVIWLLLSWNGHHGLRRRRAVAVGSGADGVALNHFSILLFDSTYLLMSATRRVDHRKARLISSRNEKAHRVARHRRCCSCSCLFPIVRFACCSTYEGLTTVLARLN